MMMLMMAVRERDIEDVCECVLYYTTDHWPLK